MEVLDTITRLKAELDALRPIAPEQEQRIMQKFRLDWNYHSNHLEGNSLTFGETKALILFGITAQGKPLKDHLEMTGHNEVLKMLEEVVKEERPLTESFIRQLHELLLKEPYYADAITADGTPTRKLIQIGQYKEAPNHVRTATGEMFYFANPEETPAKMTDLIDWYREKSASEELHPLLLAAEFHYKFVRIHPFDDGNGRMARILMNFILMQKGYPPVIIKTEDKQNYFLALQQADAGLLEPFIDYIGENLTHSLQLMIKGAKGESVEEADDVDKEIALLEQRLKVKGKAYKILRSSKSIAHVLEGVFLPLIDDYQSIIRELSQFYEYAKITMPNIGIDLKTKDKATTSTALKEVTNIRFHQTDTDQGLLVAFVFKLFNSEGVKPFDYFTNIKIHFSETNYLIEIVSKSLSESFRISKPYDSLLSQEEIKSIARVAAKAHHDFIQQKLDAADQNT